jgi:hypothetical protein
MRGYNSLSKTNVMLTRGPFHKRRRSVFHAGDVTSQNVAVSIPDEVIQFSTLPNPFKYDAEESSLL